MIRCREAVVNVPQAATSARVRLQPLQSPVSVAISHICTQGVSIDAEIGN